MSRIQSVVERVGCLYGEPGPMRNDLVRESADALASLFAGQENKPVIIANLPGWSDRHLLSLDGAQADILLLDGLLEIVILVPNDALGLSEAERKMQFDVWLQRDPQNHFLFFDNPAEARKGTPEAIYKIASATLDQEEKRYGDLEAKARNFFASNSIVLGTGGLGLANAFSSLKLDQEFRGLIGVPCLIGVLLGIVASVLFYVVQRTKTWDGRPSPVEIVSRYRFYEADGFYVVMTEVLERSYGSLSRVNDGIAKVLAWGVWVSLASILFFFGSLLMLLWGFFCG
ncbi:MULTISPECIES: hypothetical protein [unclassified Corallococcus]|uniref:hypothetical protein n=1 Tax=unclassified Corallococcus TaxID=2685029 RepID=UPI001A8DF148|nr:MULTISPECIES: hypothetical protein [unclassified Corallococcus]MBN9681830.1 hypothetical protein [Corallococcus sp. NCSPR001]WAS86600.1 hypothetical protein O0N60_06400 [Corallococcus sp. NCRR]